MKKFSILLVSSFFIGSVVNAQGDFRKGYIITNDLDSISGFVDYRPEQHNERECVFKKERKGKAVKYKPIDLMAYGFYGDKRYERKNIKNKTGTEIAVFVQVLVQGTMSLFRYGPSYYVQLDSLIKLPLPYGTIVDTEKGKRFKENVRYKGLLNFLMYDCRLSAEKIEYNERPLTNLVQNFNRCKGVAGLTFKENKPVTQFDFQIFGGFDISSLEVDGYKKSISPTAGISVDFSSPRIFDKIFFSVEAWYMKKSYQGYFKQTFGSTTTYYDVLIDESFMKVPVGLRYNFWKDTRTPYLKGGIAAHLFPKSTESVLIERQSSGQVSTESYDRDISNKSFSLAGYWFSVGYCQVVNPKFKGFIELRYEKTGAFGKVTSPVSNFIILAGLRF